MAQKKADNTLKQGSILAVASIISRLIGMVYRIPMTHIIGNDGIGLYSYAFEIYSYALILSTYCMPLAVSKLLSTRFAEKDYRNGLRIFKASMLFSLVSGGLMSILIFVFAEPITDFSGYPGAAKALRVLAPTIFLVAIAGTLRGFFQSRKTMIPTAISQLGEQIVNAIVSIVASALLVGAVASEVSSAVTDTQIAAAALKRAEFGAAGGTLGTLFGAVASVLFLGFIYVVFRPTMQKLLNRDRHKTVISPAETAKLLAATILPIVMSQAVYQSIGILDSTIFGRIQTMRGVDEQVINSVYGMYSGQYRLMVNVPNAISSSLASSMIPTLVGLYTLGNMADFRNRLASTMKFNMIIAFPCAAGLIALSLPILELIFGGKATALSGDMLFFGGIAVIFYALSTISNAALQGLDRLNIPLRHAAISLVLHLAILVPLLLFAPTAFGAYALVIGNVTYPLVICILNWSSVNRYAEYRQELKTSFVLPAACSLAMGVFVWILRKILGFALPKTGLSNLMIVLVCMITAVILYAVMICLTKTVTKEDMPDFPMGMRLYRVAKKLHLMN